VLFYGEEIGMGENLEIEGRRAVRSPMQWSSGVNGGFSSAPPDELIRPVPDGRLGPQFVNAWEQVGSAGSMVEWMQQLVRRRRELPELGIGEHRLLETDRPEVLALRFDWEGRTVVTLHNFSTADLETEVELDLNGSKTIELWSDSEYEDSANSPLALKSHGFRWFRWAENDWSL
jgi:glycosidase